MLMGDALFATPFCHSQTPIFQPVAGTVSRPPKGNRFDIRGTMHHVLAGNTIAKQAHHKAKNDDTPNIRRISLLHFMLPVT
jgi:hypothetical protein